MTSTFTVHGPCEKCGSSDASATYSDGHTYCFSCRSYSQNSGDALSAPEDPQVHLRSGPGGRPLLKVEPRSLNKRGLTEETCRKFGYGISHYNGKTVQVAPYYDERGRLVAQKLRFANKDFRFIGDPSQATLFGQNVWRDQGRMVVVTEGEIDALSVSQAQGNKWPVVSIPNGAQGALKALRKNLEWLEGFDTVVLMFDQDEPGQTAARECAELFSPNKAKIAQLPLKDANEMIQAGRAAEIVDAVWGAKHFRPAGIVTDEEVWKALTEIDTVRTAEYPWQGLNDTLLGLRSAELVTLCAGSGIGKSLVCREMAYHLIREGEKVGYIALEENVRRSAQGLLSVHLSKPLHLLPPWEVPQEELRQAFDEVIAGGKVYFYDHFGSLESEALLSKIRFLAKGLGCTYVFLDHISIVVSGIDNGDERKAIDVTMTALRSLVQETGIGLVLVSHLRRPEGNRGHEDGQTITLAHLRGSASIAQLSDAVIGLERNQQDAEAKHTTTVRVLKSRHTGYTGVPCTLAYDPETGRLQQGAEFSEEVDREVY